MNILKGATAFVLLTAGLLTLALQILTLTANEIVVAFIVGGVVHVCLCIIIHKQLSKIINDERKTEAGNYGKPIYSELTKSNCRRAKKINLFLPILWIVFYLIFFHNPTSTSDSKGKKEIVEQQPKILVDASRSDSLSRLNDSINHKKDSLKNVKNDSILQVKKDSHIQVKNDSIKQADIKINPATPKISVKQPPPGPFIEPTFTNGYIKLGTYDSSLKEWIAPMLSQFDMSKILLNSLEVGRKTLSGTGLMHNVKPGGFNDEVKSKSTTIRILRPGDNVTLIGSIFSFEKDDQIQYWIQVECPKK